MKKTFKAAAAILAAASVMTAASVSVYAVPSGDGSYAGERVYDYAEGQWYEWNLSYGVDGSVVGGVWGVSNDQSGLPDMSTPNTGAHDTGVPNISTPNTGTTYHPSLIPADNPDAGRGPNSSSTPPGKPNPNPSAPKKETPVKEDEEEAAQTPETEEPEDTNGTEGTDGTAGEPSDTEVPEEDESDVPEVPNPKTGMNKTMAEAAAAALAAAAVIAAANKKRDE